MKGPLLKINHLKKVYHDKQGEIDAVLDFTLDIYDKEYTVDEVSDIYFAVMDKLSDNLGDEITSPDEYSKKCSDILNSLAKVTSI